MTAEEYIETIVSARTNMSWMDASKLRAILTSVMDMARKEEREKADKAFSKVIKALDVSNSKWYEELEKYFLELINQ